MTSESVGGGAEAKGDCWVVRPMRVADIEQCLEIWRQVGLVEDKQTVSSSLITDPDGFYVAELKDTGEVVGMCAGSLVTDGIAFVGFYAVAPERQNLGIGSALWARTIARLGPEINIGLYGVPAMASKYHKIGFKLDDPMRMLIYESQESHGCWSVQADKLKALEELDQGHGQGSCIKLARVNQSSRSMFQRIVDYDAAVQGFCRQKLLENYFLTEDAPLAFALIRLVAAPAAQASTKIERTRHSLASSQPTASVAADEARKLALPDCSAADIDVRRNQSAKKVDDDNLSQVAKAALSISEHNIMDPNGVEHAKDACGCQRSQQEQEQFELLGFGAIRRDNGGGAMVGPLYANSPDHCEVLLRHLVESYQLDYAGDEGKLSVMALSSNEAACGILEKVGLRQADQSLRMFTNFIPAAGSLANVFYIHSPNFTLF